MDKSFVTKLFQTHQACVQCPSVTEVASVFSELLGVLFADYSEQSFETEPEFEMHIGRLRVEVSRIVQLSSAAIDPRQVTEVFFNQLPGVYEKINEDITALYEGDPAAKSRREVIRTYPGFYAIAAYRIAHLFHTLGVPEIPRTITEHAHSRTGIDIHPAARIGHSFCIDHGTGVVIGETAVIGNHVKIYQGVTLGALSVSKEDAEKKRHPTLEDHVVVYAGATILGGETCIGHHSIIGGNVWLTRSVPPYSKIYYQSKMRYDDTEQTDVVIFR